MWRIGSIFNTRSQEQIFNPEPQTTRYLPYANKYQIAITYEVDPTQYQMERIDFTLFEWLSGIGGLGFMFRFCQLVVKWSDNPDLFVTSAMLA